MHVQRVLRIRLDLVEISKKAQNHHFLATISAQNLHDSSKKPSFPIKVKIGVDNPEGTRRRSMSVALLSSSPVKRYDPKAIGIH